MKLLRGEKMQQKDRLMGDTNHNDQEILSCLIILRKSRFPSIAFYICYFLLHSNSSSFSTLDFHF